MAGNEKLLFVVGMPRSGTKLLRDLLNRHSDVAIFPNESHFIPYFQRRYGERTDLAERRSFSQFYSEFQRTTFYRRLAQRGIVFAEEEWRNGLSGGTLQDVLRGLFAQYRVKTGATIVGDKTPEYLTQVPLLVTLFPEVRFVHIVRDPRDYALSIQQAWGKNMLRAVQRWKRQVRKYHCNVEAARVPHLTVRYEDLIADPAEVLSRVCEFLGIAYRSEMTTLGAPAEDLGDARGLSTVLPGNSMKWMTRMTSDQLRAVESIVGAMMKEFGYEPTTVAGDDDLKKSKELLYQAADAAKLFKFRLRAEGGVLPALEQTWRAHRHAGADE